MHYVVGDVHGYYRTLLALVGQLPAGAALIFVGDLIDRGRESAETVRFVRGRGHRCVMGNHEAMMVEYGKVLCDAYERGRPLERYNRWYANGGIETLRSYGLIRIVDGKPAKVDAFEAALERFKSDMAWMAGLPLYAEPDHLYKGNRPVVVSHAPVGDVWELRHHPEADGRFADAALTNRHNPGDDAPIFNIFGHTPRAHAPVVGSSYVNVDAGCYIDDGSGYGNLCAYCIESGETVCQANVG